MSLSRPLSRRLGRPLGLPSVLRVMDFTGDDWVEKAVAHNFAKDDPMVVEFDLYLDAVPTAFLWFAGKQTGSGLGWRVCNGLSETRDRMSLRLDDGATSIQIVDSGALLTAGEITRWRVTHDGAGTVKIYRNGVLSHDETASVSGLGDITTGAAFAIGARSADGAGAIDGSIWNVRVNGTHYPGRGATSDDWNGATVVGGAETRLIP